MSRILMDIVRHFKSCLSRGKRTQVPRKPGYRTCGIRELRMYGNQTSCFRRCDLADCRVSQAETTQEALAARAACGLAICSFIFCCISLGVGSATCVAIIQL